MRWNCPHCGTSLAVADEKLGNAWSFSRCYKCGGFALARLSEPNLIKVDRAPEGEPVLLPEAHEDPTTMLSKAATAHLATYLEAKNRVQVQRASQSVHQAAIKPTVRAVTRKNHAHPQAQAQAIQPLTAAPRAPAAFGLPEPLPETPKPTIQQRLLPVAIGLTGIMAIASGIYLYLQGQAIWDRAQTQAQHAAAESSEESAAQPPKASAPREVIAAPSHLSAAPPAPAHVGNANPVAPPATAPAIVTPPPAAPAAVATRPELTDEVHARAMAPTRETPQMRVEVLIDNAHIRSGPGLQYPIVGSVRSRQSYAVEEWKDRWFKITLQEKEKAPKAAPKAAPRVAWIRNELVRPVGQ